MEVFVRNEVWHKMNYQHYSKSLSVENNKVVLRHYLLCSRNRSVYKRPIHLHCVLNVRRCLFYNSHLLCMGRISATLQLGKTMTRIIWYAFPGMTDSNLFFLVKVSHDSKNWTIYHTINLLVCETSLKNINYFIT